MKTIINTMTGYHYCASCCQHLCSLCICICREEVNNPIMPLSLWRLPGFASCWIVGFLCVRKLVASKRLKLTLLFQSIWILAGGRIWLLLAGIVRDADTDPTQSLVYLLTLISLSAFHFKAWFRLQTREANTRFMDWTAQRVAILSPVSTALRFLPMGALGFIGNIIVSLSSCEWVVDELLTVW
jgi:hypothetical protein